MEPLNLHLLSFDVSFAPDGPSAFADKVAGLVECSWDLGADVVVLPEFLWLGLERFVDSDDPIRKVAGMFHDQIWPALARRLACPNKVAVLGTTPFLDAGGSLRNRAPIVSDRSLLHQDKIHLTPWESAFTGGGPLRVWNFRGVSIAVVICLDIEIPTISTALRGTAVDLILVPSATDSLMGVERVGRCADARAVELGCHVGVCHLLGKTPSELIDENTGRLAAYSPSQSAFADRPRQIETEVFTDGFHRLGVELDLEAVRRNRSTSGETDPSKVAAATPILECL